MRLHRQVLHTLFLCTDFGGEPSIFSAPHELGDAGRYLVVVYMGGAVEHDIIAA